MFALYSMLDCKLLLDSAKRFGFIQVGCIGACATRECFSGDLNCCHASAVGYGVVNE